MYVFMVLYDMLTEQCQRHLILYSEVNNITL